MHILPTQSTLGLTEFVRLILNLGTMQSTTFDTLKATMELNNGGYFWSLLKEPENYHFFIDKAKVVQNVYFEPNISTINWSDDYIVNHLINNEGSLYDEIIVDVQIEGSLNEFNNKGFTYSKQLIKFQFTLQSFVFAGDYGITREDIKLLNSEQKTMLLFHKNYEKEIDRLDVKMLFENKYCGDEAFTFFTRIWKQVDTNNATQVSDSSNDYFDEFVECHRNILYSVAMSNIWGRYKTNYTSQYYNFQGTKIFPLNLNYQDNRFIFYLENAIEEIYTFYERIAYLLFLFLKPVGLTQSALSFNKLFERKVKKELKQKYPHLASDKNYLWFEKRVKKEHKELSGFRHPLIHYQTNNTFIKGGYNSSLKRIWLENTSGGEQGLLKLSEDIKNIQKFINQELIMGKEAFEKTILLIENLNIPPNN